LTMPGRIGKGRFSHRDADWTYPTSHFDDDESGKKLL
jgi:hypothetical protein